MGTILSARRPPDLSSRRSAAAPCACIFYKEAARARRARHGPRHARRHVHTSPPRNAQDIASRAEATRFFRRRFLECQERTRPGTEPRSRDDRRPPPAARARARARRARYASTPAQLNE
ncbi:hypothetical protein EVAR_64097_1 [Eumeta japonica]|uniref:Uncharacterized protein n=1 Tax=Eumeta variegata TaxID=151549 RepID=A0A4C1ZGP5_EUMVA|nr:hypothetical protein EVAR_64097_1 [Eumeta japonica]